MLSSANTGAQVSLLQTPMFFFFVIHCADPQTPKPRLSPSEIRPTGFGNPFL
jgi:hypothetical protein